MDSRRDQTHQAPRVKALDVDGVRTVAIITVLWAAAFVVLALQRGELEEADRSWWLWACLAGVGLGLLGLEYCRKRRDAITRAELRAEAEADLDDQDWAGDESDDPQRTAEYVPHDPPTPPPSTGDHPTVPYSAGGRPPPGYVTGEFPAVTSPGPVTEDIPPQSPGPGHQEPRHRQDPDPIVPVLPDDPAAPAGYSPDPDHGRRHPRDEELTRRRQQPARHAASGGDKTASEFFSDDLRQDPARADEFLLEDDSESRDRPMGRRARREAGEDTDGSGGERRGRRARRD